MSKQFPILRRLSMMLFALMAAACGNESGSGKSGPVDAAWSEVKEKFAENGVTADAYYKAHPVRLSGEVQTIAASSQYAATLRLSDESPEPFTANIQRTELAKIKALKAGEYITIVCNSVYHGETANDCVIEKIESTIPPRLRKNRSLKNPPETGAR